MDKNGFAIRLMLILFFMAIGTSIMNTNINNHYKKMYPEGYAVSFLYHEKISDDGTNMITEEHNYVETGKTEKIDGIVYDVYICELCQFRNLKYHEDEEETEGEEVAVN